MIYPDLKLEKLSFFVKNILVGEIVAYVWPCTFILDFYMNEYSLNNEDIFNDIEV